MDGRPVLDALARMPGGPELLRAGAAGADVALVGGAVRDLLLGAEPRELDVVAGADAWALAAELSAQLGATATETRHERFGTAIVAWDGGRIDIARRRAESYPAPGALPVVREGTVEEDLLRRDFSVNALAVALGGSARGELRGVEHALDDLEHARLRVLHDDSFDDDPTRLLRLARYASRLAFAVEPHTAELAARAVRGGALATVSGARVGAELRLALEETDPLGALAALDALGVLGAIDPQLALDRELARNALALLPADGSRTALLLGSLLADEQPRAPAGLAPSPAARHAGELLDRLEFTAGERDRAVDAAASARTTAAAIAAADRPSQLHRALAGRAPEAVALAGAAAGGAAEAGAREWLTRLRHVRLQIDGDDVLSAGVPAGPEVGARLAHALRLRLDGELPDGREAELRAALEAPS